ncbi:hypothetical protein ACFL4F_03515, partial [Candidatus Margulisiibacteriota bacterium]
MSIENINGHKVDFLKKYDKNNDGEIKGEEIKDLKKDVSEKLFNMIDNEMFFTSEKGNGIITKAEIEKFNTVIKKYASILKASDLKGSLADAKAAIDKAIAIYNDPNTTFSNQDLEKVMEVAVSLAKGSLLGKKIEASTKRGEFKVVDELKAVIDLKFKKNRGISEVKDSTDIYWETKLDPAKGQKYVDDFCLFLSSLALISRLPEATQKELLGTDKALPVFEGALNADNIAEYLMGEKAEEKSEKAGTTESKGGEKPVSSPKKWA